MVQLLESDIKTREVLGWKGVHVLHFVQRLRAKREFASEIAMPPESVARLEATHNAQLEAGKTLEQVAGF